MADLTGNSIASSYDQLLSLPSGGGSGTSLVAITDGDGGNTFALKLATDKVRIEKLGILTDSPEASLDVNTSITGNTGVNYGVIIRGSEVSGTNLEAGDGIGLKFEVPADTATSAVGASIEALKAVGTDSSHETKLLFKTSGSNETLNTTFTMFHNQNVAIEATKEFYLDGGSNTFISEVSADTMQFTTGGTERLRLDSNSRISLSNNDDGGTTGTNSTTGNSIFGYNSGNSIQSGGVNNSFYGHNSGTSVTTGDANVCIGSESDVGTNTDNNSIVIGKGAIGNGSNTAVIGGASITDVYLGHDGNSATAYSGGQVVQGDGNVTMWKVVNYTIAANTELDTGIDTSHSFMAFVGATESDNTNGDTAIIACAGGTISTVATSQGFITVNSSTVAANRTGFYSTSNTLRIKSTFANGIDVSIAIMQAR